MLTFHQKAIGVLKQTETDQILLKWEYTQGGSYQHAFMHQARSTKVSSQTHLEDIVPVSIQGSLGQLDDEHTVGPTGLTVQLSVGNPALLLTWERHENITITTLTN